MDPNLCAFGAVVGALALGPALSAAAQDARLTRDRYRALVSVYRDGKAGTIDLLKARAVAPLPPLIAEVLGAARSEWEVVDLQAAAMLHTDAAVELLREGRTDDGVAHVNAASHLIDATIDLSTPDRTYAARWYAFAIAIVRLHSQPWSEELDQRRRSRFAETPADRAMHRGLAQELATRTGPVRPYDAPVITNPALEFEEVVRRDPDMFEAWLHLGRVRMSGPQLPAAEDALRQAARSPERRIRYMAAMFLGALSELTGRMVEAERSYRQAAAVYPWAQSPALALAQLLGRLAREGEARELLAAHLRRPRTTVIDPLWTYYMAPDEFLDATLQQLRVEVMR